MGPQDSKDVARDIARDLSALVGELAALRGDATHTGSLTRSTPLCDTAWRLRMRRQRRRWWTRVGG